MGRGSYTASDWAKLRSSRRLDSSRSVETMFTGKQADAACQSNHILCRFSCDPAPSVEATPVIIGFDVTASMGYLAKELATHCLHSTVTALLSGGQISAPQILCAAIGDCKSDTYPLQVTQFEADIRMIRQLLELHLEGGGGGNGGESYNLLWYFAARHTHHDHFRKRQKKGFLFTIGDDFCHSGLSAAEVGRCFPGQSVFPISNAELLAEVGQTYHPFHIHIESGRPSDGEIFRHWCQLLPGRCTLIHRKDIPYLPGLITAIIAIAGGQTPETVLGQLDTETAEHIARSVAAIRLPEETNTITF